MAATVTARTLAALAAPRRPTPAGPALIYAGAGMDGGIDWSKLTRSELIAIAGGLLLAASLFFAWYHAKVNGTINGHAGPWTGSGWTVHPILRWLLLAAAAAP